MIKTSVLGSMVSHCTYESATDHLFDIVAMGAGGLVTPCNVHMVMEAYHDDSFRRKLNEFDLVTPDGQPVRWALNLLAKAGLGERVCGPELMLHLLRRAGKEGKSVFLYGASEKTLDRLKTELEKIEGLRVAGMISPPFRQTTDDENRHDIDEINNSGASICFVGLGCPKQEKWAYDNRAKVKPLLVCVGAAFDFHAGNVDRAPVWMQRYGLEWLFRLVKEPRRVWRRYIFNNPLYLILLFLQWAGLKKFQS